MARNTQTTSLAEETLRPVSPPPWCKSSMCSLPTPASPTSALNIIYSFCRKRHLQLWASKLFVQFQYLRPGARTLPRASDQLLEKLDFGFLDFCSLLWPWPWPFIFDISCEFQYKCRIMTFDPQTQCLNDQEQHAWFPLSICRVVSRK